MALTKITSRVITDATNKQFSKAWVNFDATRNASGGADSANTARYIRSSFNVTSVTKTGTGIYLITFATSMTDANYCAIGNGSGGTPVSMSATGTTTASFSALSYYGGSYIDTAWNTIVVFGN
jgi:hypothetical protein